EVIVSVTAMKKTPINPPRASAFDEALSQEEGRRISNIPSRLSPNAINASPNSKFSQGLLPNFVVEAPNTTVAIKPISVYMLMIAKQYTRARRVALPPPAWLCLTKKLTVMGTRGQTHGISTANRPCSAAIRRKGTKPFRMASPISPCGSESEELDVAGG